jgi:hypothetical protein
MVSITDKDIDITVEAETLAKARRQLNKAKKDKAEQQARENAVKEVSYSRAYEAIGRMCSTAWDGLNHNGDLPKGYRVYPVEHAYAYIRHEVSDMGASHTYTMDTEHGQGSATFYRKFIAYTLQNGAGYTLAVRTKDPQGWESTGDIPWLAVGSNEGKLAFVRIPTILATVLDNLMAEAETPQ